MTRRYLYARFRVEPQGLKGAEKSDLRTRQQREVSDRFKVLDREDHRPRSSRPDP